MGKFIDLKGQRYGRLVIVSREASDINRQARWLCKCDCGNTKIALANNIRRGIAASCGCLQREWAKTRTLPPNKIKHGRRAGIRKKRRCDRTYTSWTSMRTRCLNPRNKCYSNYGGRGITICPQWDDFKVFLRDMGERPDNTTLDRIDVNGNYEPSNCRWATPLVQRHNQRRCQVQKENSGDLLMSYAVCGGIC